jgi:hypothetical protein
VTGNHPRHDLDALSTNPVRLSIVVALADVERAEFGLVRDTVEIADAMLSKQVALLEEKRSLASRPTPTRDPQ